MPKVALPGDTGMGLVNSDRTLEMFLVLSLN